MKLIGILLILNSLALTGWWITSGNNHKAAATSLCLVAVFAGLVMLLQDRITELTVKGVGTIKAASEQVLTDANTVADLKQRVENQSATIDMVAKEATKAKTISEEASEQNRIAEEKLLTLNESIKEASASLAELNAAKDFTMTVVAAQNDDRSAFDTLKERSNDSSNPYSDAALRAWNTIYESHNEPMHLGNFNMPWKEGFDPSKLTLIELAQQYSGVSDQLKPAMLEYIWKRNDLPKVGRLDFMINVMKTDSSLTAVEYAGRHFTAGTEQKIKPMAVEYLEDWWAEHRHEFQQK